MKLNETQGIVINNKNSWEQLCDLITRYIYDINDGMSSDPLYEDDLDDTTIDNELITSYSLYKYGKKPVLPIWLENFEIHLLKLYHSNGSFVKAKSPVQDGKMKLAYINIKDSVDRTPDLVEDTLAHEFRHAFDFYIERTYTNRKYTARDVNIYKEASMGFKGNSIIKEVHNDYILLIDDIYTNKETLCNTIRCSMYYTDKGELNSFLLEFATDIKRQISNNKELIIELIKEANKKKLDFNKLNAIEKWNSNILNSLDITCYNSRYYLIYKAYLQFWNNIEHVDDELAEEVVEEIKKPIRLVLNKLPGKKLVNFSGDATSILKELKMLQTPIFDKICQKMAYVFAHYILDIVDEINNKK